MTKTTRGIVFVHGINQDQKALVGMQGWVEGQLLRYGVLDQFINPADRSKNVWCGKWRSLGTFMGDLEDLFRHKARRDEAVADISAVIQQAWDSLNKQAAGQKCGLLVLGHSMGQPLALAALHGLQHQVPMVQPVKMAYPMPTSFLSVGGPLGNDDPIFRQYLSHGIDGSAWVRSFCPRKPEALKEWTDMFNPLDPVAQDMLVGSSAYPGSNHMMFKVPGQPPIAKPFSNPIADYHSAYFQHPEIYRLVTQMLDDLLA